jgi:hypothetical protein
MYQQHTVGAASSVVCRMLLHVILWLHAAQHPVQQPVGLNPEY